MKQHDAKEFLRLRRECSKTVLDLHKRANTGHISSSLCPLGVMIYMHFFKMTARDQFILSKGHSALGLYAVLAKAGKISPALLSTCYRDGTLLGAHPPCGFNKIPGVTFGTGSLGHGLSIATGVALARKMRHSTSNTYCLISDGECNEGSIWEAALFAGHHALSNLIVVIDVNGLQAFGKTEEVLDMEPLGDKWRSFGFEVVHAVGKSYASLDAAFKAPPHPKKPRCIIVKTDAVISFMKSKIEWHYRPLDEEQYVKAKDEIAKLSS